MLLRREDLQRGLVGIGLKMVCDQNLGDIFAAKVQRHRCRNRGGACDPQVHKLLYKLLTTLCVVSAPPPIKKSFLHP